MRRISIGISLAAGFILGSTVSFAREPKPFAHSAEIKAPYAKVYQNLKRFFALDSSHLFEATEADEKLGVIRAKRIGIDSRTFGEWAYCKTSPLNLLDSLQDATVTVKVRLEKDSPTRTHVAVTTEFVGEYSLAGTNTHTITCETLGALEDQILAAAGPSVDEQ